MSAARLVRVLLRLVLALPVAAWAAGPAPVAIGIVGWPQDSADAMHALVSEFETCLSRHIRSAAPEATIVPQRAIRDALFPLLEPATQPASEEAFAQLLARADVRARLGAHGLRYLVAFTGATRKGDWRGPLLCGAGYGGGGCLGFAWRDERTALDAALWSLDGTPTVRHEGATTEGTSIMPAFGIPVPLVARSGAAACRELGERIATAIRELEGGSPGAQEAPAHPND